MRNLLSPLIPLVFLSLFSGTSMAVKGETEFEIFAKARFDQTQRLITGRYRAIYRGATPICDYIKLFCREKPKSSYYISESTTYLSSPLRKVWYDTYTEISSIRIKGREIDLERALKTGMSTTILLADSSTIDPGDTIEVEYTVHLMNMEKGSYLGDDWLPLVRTSSDEEFVFSPLDITSEITVPKGYSLISSGVVTRVDTSGGFTTYAMESRNVPVTIVLISKDIKLARKSRVPIDYSIWSVGCELNLETIRLIEDQISNYHALFGPPIGHGGELNICIIGFSKNILGAMMGNLIAINSIYIYSPLAGLLGGSTTIAHELMHYWWINRMYGRLTANDVMFHECFIDHLLEFYSPHVLGSQRSGVMKLARKLLAERSSRNFLEYSRCGYSFAVLPDSTGKEVPFAEKSAKGIFILNALADLHGRNRWEERILKYFNMIKAGAPITFGNFCRASDDSASYIELLFTKDSDFDYAVTGVRSERLKNGMVKSEVTMENRGGIPVPVPVRVTFEDGTVSFDTLTMEKGRSSLFKLHGTRIKCVSIDPDCRLPDPSPSNNDFPRKVNLSFLSRSLNGNATRNMLSVDLLPLNMMPIYSEDTGLEFVATPATIRGKKKNTGVILKPMRSELSFHAGYNFKAKETLWGTRLEVPISSLPTPCSLELGIGRYSTSRSASVVFSGGHSGNPFHHPAHSWNLTLCRIEYLRPVYRDESWPTGTELSIAGNYSFMNMNTLFHPFNGYRIVIEAQKALGVDWSDWNFEKVSSQVEIYRAVLVPTVLALRLRAGHIFGFAPIQEQLGLARDGLMGSFDIFEKTGRSIVSLNTELRLKETFTPIEPVLFARSSSLRPYGEEKFINYSEAGVALRVLDNSSLSLSIDFVLLKKLETRPTERCLLVRLKLGSPFAYSPMRLRL